MRRSDHTITCFRASSVRTLDHATRNIAEHRLPLVHRYVLALALIVSPIVFFAPTLPWRIEPHDVTFDISLGAWYSVLLAVIAWRPHLETRASDEIA